MIDLGSEQLVEHVHGGGEQDAHISLAGAPTEGVSQKGLAHAGIADDHDASALLEEVEIEQPEDAVPGLLPGFVMGEVELVEGRLSGKMRKFEAALDDALAASFQFEVSQPFQGRGEAKILIRRLSRHHFQVLSHGGQGQLVEFLFQGHRQTPFGPRG